MPNAYLKILIAQLPSLEFCISRLHRDDPEFRSICEEMEMADAARTRWQHMPERTSEYQEICDRLRDEFLDHLSRHTGDAVQRSPQQGVKDHGRNS